MPRVIRIRQMLGWVEQSVFLGTCNEKVRGEMGLETLQGLNKSRKPFFMMQESISERESKKGSQVKLTH